MLLSAHSVVVNSDIDFLALSKKEKSPRMRIRLLALAHIKDGTSYREVAKMLKTSTHSVQTYANKFRDSGIDGLRDKEGRGRKPNFPRDKEKELEKVILEKQKKRNGGRLTGNDIHKIVENDFGIKCALRTIYDLLHRIDFVCISSRSKHPKSDKKTQEDFKRNFKKKNYRSSA